MTVDLGMTLDPVAPAPEQTGLFVGGGFRPASDGAVFDVTDPAGGDVIATVADATPADASNALNLAAEQQTRWGLTSPTDRAGILHKVARRLEEECEEFAALMTTEMGKPLAESRAEVAYAAGFFSWFASQATSVSGRFAVSPGGSRRILTMPRPVGPALLITPWNFPLAMGARKIAPAIAAGCTILAKPAVETPLSMLRLASTLADAGVPDGVLAVLPTSRPEELVAPLFADDRLRKLSFTGSTKVGAALARQAADGVIRVSLELGGNAPFIVLPDADLPRAVEAAAQAKLRNGGQACTAANRFVVHEAIHDEFVERLAERFGREVLGPGFASGTTLGPLIDHGAYDRITRWVDAAVADGARVHRLPTDLPPPFLPATVVSGTRPGMQLVEGEIFGPVAPVMSYSTTNQAIALANGTEMGLVAYLHTSDLERGLDLVEHLEVGMVAINEGLVSDPAAPFGGLKLSGIGKEGGIEGLHEYLETTYVAVRRDPRQLT